MQGKNQKDNTHQGLSNPAKHATNSSAGKAQPDGKQQRLDTAHQLWPSAIRVVSYYPFVHLEIKQRWRLIDER